MANAAAKMFTSYLDSREMNYSILDEAQRVIRMGWTLEGTKMAIFFEFAEDGANVRMEGREFLNFPADKINTMYKIVNDCNRKYRWIKFSVDAESNTAVVECDAVIQLDSCAEEVSELMFRMIKIVEDAYPLMMKALWA